ncbi:Metallo-dependent hydrolase [Piedraia hortae CBS 480.64]|uniref:adenosine deaminase n=1 Tax=Piedraia hortae CBS 480.64 TaxID=1314780 RepID=A0A6A7BR10_9PEZI|nr:Metallo-dependent hydrolase [Piedraia hortae CBS 480.64]
MQGSVNVMTDSEWAEELGIPNVEEPLIQKYLDGRDALIEQEKRQRSDDGFRNGLSAMAREACAIVAAIRFKEQQTLWSGAYEDEVCAQFDAHPGMMYSLARDRMKSSKLWKIIKKMPKGALLHCHLGAMGDIEWLIAECFDTEGICLISDAPLVTDAQRQSVSISIVHDKSATESATSLWIEDYKSQTPVLIHEAAASFPGGKEAFIKWLVSRASITQQDSLSSHTGPNAIWQKFASCFSVVGPIQMYEPIFRKFIRRMMEQFVDDGVCWADVRAVFIQSFTRANSSTPDQTHEYMLTALQEEVDTFRTSPKGKQFWGLRLIWTTLRAGNTRTVVADMQACIEMKKLFPDLISGYDFVGHEDAGRTLAELTPELFWFKKRCLEEDVNLPFFFHAGETLGDGDPTDENLFDAILLGTRRIGHGFSLYKHPLLLNMVKERQILVESCPISNEVLRLTGSILQHPLPALIARGVPCCLSCDDPAIMGQGGDVLSPDFWQALQGWENLGLAGLASLAENSVKWANYEDCSPAEWKEDLASGVRGKGVRAQRMSEWRSEFEKFCQWVVLEYAEELEVEID